MDALPMTHPLRDNSINDLSPKKCLIPFHEVSGLDIQPEVGYTRHEHGAIVSTHDGPCGDPPGYRPY
jgi:hypothetical protein